MRVQRLPRGRCILCSLVASPRFDFCIGLRLTTCAAQEEEQEQRIQLLLESLLHIGHNFNDTEAAWTLKSRNNYINKSTIDFALNITL